MFSFNKQTKRTKLLCDVNDATIKEKLSEKITVKKFCCFYSENAFSYVKMIQRAKKENC